MANKGRSAYDLSLFEDKNTLIVPSKRPDRKYPTKVDPKEELRKRKAKQRMIARKRKEATALAARIAAASVLVLVLVTATIYSKVILSETVSDIEVQTKALKEMKSIENQLRNDIDQKSTHKKIEEYANGLGLVKMEPQQHKSINSSDGNTVEIAESEEKTDWFDSFIDMIKGETETPEDLDDENDPSEDTSSDDAQSISDEPDSSTSDLQDVDEVDNQIEEDVLE